MATQSTPDRTPQATTTQPAGSTANNFGTTDPPASDVLLGADFSTLSGPEQTARLADLA